MEVAKAVRKAAGDDFILLMDPVGVYTREEAIKVGRLLDELNYVAYEDPIPTTDIDGLVELCRALDVPIHVGEFIFSPYSYAEYIRRQALDVVRLIVDIGGITGAMKVATRPNASPGVRRTTGGWARPRGIFTASWPCRIMCGSK